MQRPSSEDIARLEEKIIILKRQLRADGLPSYRRAELELALANAEQALGLFRRAYGEQRASIKENT